jgi:putative tributyrin esterase
MNVQLKRLMIFALFLTVAWQSHGQTSLVEDSLFSTSLGTVKAFRVLSPPLDRKAPLRPGLVLLHGFGGNYRNWTELTQIRRIIDSLQIVVIMPDGENSWYVNSLFDSTARFEDYIVRDVVPVLSKRFGVDTARTGIAGLSMGGYGSLVLGLRHPDTFCFIGAMSSSLDIPFGIPLLDQKGRGGLKSSLIATFGEEQSQWSVYDPFRLLPALDPEHAPYVYLVTGIQDQFGGRLVLHRSFAQLLSIHAFHYEYHETPGRHNWDFWGREIRGVIMRFLAVANGKN